MTVNKQLIHVLDLPSTSADYESNISNQDNEGDGSSHPTDTPDMDSEDPTMWFPVREKHVSFWSKAAMIFQNKKDSDSYSESQCYYQSGKSKLDEHCHYFKNSMREW